MIELCVLCEPPKVVLVINREMLNFYMKLTILIIDYCNIICSGNSFYMCLLLQETWNSYSLHNFRGITSMSV